MNGPVISNITAFPYWAENSIKPQLVVKIETTDNITGWGEAGFTFRELAVIGAIEHLKDLLIGQDSFKIGALWQEMYRRHYFEGCRTVSAAMSAIDVALYDIKGKALGVPVYELLGGKQRENIPCFPTTNGINADEMIQSAKSLQQRGFETIRLHILPIANAQDNIFEPREAIVTTADAVKQVRKECGDRVFLGLDFHHRLNIAEAASFAQKIPNGTLDFLEEPIRAQSFASYQELRKLTNIPFAIGEEFTSKWDFLPFVDNAILNFARIDIANVGGITEAMKIAGWCEAKYIDIMPHNPLGPINTAATLHFSAAIQNFSSLEARQHQIHNPLGVDKHIFPDQQIISGTSFQTPNAPGLGISVNEDALLEETHKYRKGHHDRLIRKDGSLTNI